MYVNLNLLQWVKAPSVSGSHELNNLCASHMPVVKIWVECTKTGFCPEQFHSNYAAVITLCCGELKIIENVHL